MADNAINIVWVALDGSALEKGFTKKFEYANEDGDILATYALRRAKRGQVLYVRIGDDKTTQLESVCPVTEDNLEKVITDHIEAELDGPICEHCHGTGIFIKRNGDEGDCFRCKGKGFQSKRDQARNKSYDDRQGGRQAGSVSDATI